MRRKGMIRLASVEALRASLATVETMKETLAGFVFNEWPGFEVADGGYFLTADYEREGFPFGDGLSRHTTVPDEAALLAWQENESERFDDFLSWFPVDPFDFSWEIGFVQFGSKVRDFDRGEWRAGSKDGFALAEAIAALVADVNSRLGALFDLYTIGTPSQFYGSGVGLLATGFVVSRSWDWMTYSAHAVTTMENLPGRLDDSPGLDDLCTYSGPHAGGLVWDAFADEIRVRRGLVQGVLDAWPDASGLVGAVNDAVRIWRNGSQQRGRGR